LKGWQVRKILDDETLSFSAKIGNWFLLYLLVKNLDPLAVNDVIKVLHLDASEKSSDSTEARLLTSMV